MKKVKLFCVLLLLIGIGLFAFSYFFLSQNNILFSWCIGLGCAFIIMGVGFLINISYHSMGIDSDNSMSQLDLIQEFSKEKAGYLTCKIMNILLCIYILVIEHQNVSQTLLFITILLLVLQYLLNLLLYLHYSRKKDN